MENVENMENLKKVIEELNAPNEIDGVTYESPYDFKIKDNKIYDVNECYNIDWLEEQNCLMYDASQEFGFEFEPMSSDTIHDKLLEAVKKDFGEDSYLEWENNVVMVIVEC